MNAFTFFVFIFIVQSTSLLFGHNRKLHSIKLKSFWDNSLEIEKIRISIEEKKLDRELEEKKIFHEDKRRESDRLLEEKKLMHEDKKLLYEEKQKSLDRELEEKKLLQEEKKMRMLIFFSICGVIGAIFFGAGSKQTITELFLFLKESRNIFIAGFKLVFGLLASLTLIIFVNMFKKR